MIIKFWGVRGSVPTPDPKTLRYGGNTSCVSVEVNGKLLVLDAGSGIRYLGRHLQDRQSEIFIVLTHRHRDHIEGFPFFNPLYEEGNAIYLVDHPLGDKSWSLMSMLDGVNYPMRPQSITADCQCIPHDGIPFLQEAGFQVARLPVNHPGGAFGYRIEDAGRVFVHMPDNEINSPDPNAPTSFDRFVEFCRGADVLSHDAMFVDDDLPMKAGWGHSRVHEVCQLAIAAQVRHLILFHHDPERYDDTVDLLQDLAEEILTPHGILCTAAYEGLTFDLA